MGASSVRIEEVLAGVPPFDALLDGQRRALARECQLVRLRARDVLLGDGEASNRAYILLSGHLNRSLFTPDGSRIIVNSTGPVRTFALTAAFESGPHAGFIEAEADSEVVGVPAPAVRELFSLNASFALAVAHSMARSSLYQTQVIQELLFPVPMRVARHLLASMDAAGRVRIESKAELAGKMATRPETLSRALASLKKSGLIAMDGRELRVTDPQALRAFCSAH